MAKIRLVAYRNATTSDTQEQTYELDLQEAPSISLNFQFSDVKEPEKRKGNFSQTFKLPFTDKNNEFFENWFNVNLSTLVFSTRKRFNAALYVGTVTQFEGIIKLKAVYQKAQQYEVVLLSNSVDLFSEIGSKKLIDVFKNDDGSYSAELNHTYNYDNLKYSWDGSSTSFQNLAGQSLRDADAGVQKVMYPFSITKPNFYFSGAESNEYLSMTSTSGYEGDDYLNSVVDITQFRPAIQLKALFKLIIARAGFSYTSSFIDGSYFGKLFMTTCGHLGTGTTPVTTTTAGVEGTMLVGNSEAFYTSTVEPATCYIPFNYLTIPADTTSPTSDTCNFPMDNSSMWNTTYNYFTRLGPTQTEVRVRFRINGLNLQTCSNGIDSNILRVWVALRSFNTTTNTVVEEISSTYVDIVLDENGDVPLSAGGSGAGFEVDVTLPLIPSGAGGMWSGAAAIPIGGSGVLQTRVSPYIKKDPSQPISLILGSNGSCGITNRIKIQWDGYTNETIYGSAINIPACIDDKLTQKQFLKDLIERFNLVVIADKDNPSNIIIEDYDSYISGGEIKNWSKKIDLDKEIIIKDTTGLQKKEIHLTDKEDVDLLNKITKEDLPDINVYGKIEITETNNELAEGEMKNTPIFSPYRNERVFQSDGDLDQPSLLFNVAVQYEYSYTEIEGGTETRIEKTNPKLFYYSGTPTNIGGGVDTGSGTSSIYMHIITFNLFSAKAFSSYPLCSAYEIGPTGSPGTGTLANTTRSLFWNQAPPEAGDLSCFNYNEEQVLSLQSLYYEYWFQYLNQLYHPDARIMECHLNLNEVDIYNFKFSDEIFIKDTYWRILDIKNYQVGSKASTKVTLIKMGELYDNTCADCNYLPSSYNGNNMLGQFFIWCPSNNPGCTPSLPGSLYADIPSCEAQGGLPFLIATNQASNGLYPCMANTGSLPITLQSIYGTRNIIGSPNVKSLLSGIIGSKNKPLLVGVNTNKYAQNILPNYGNDIVIKYSTSARSTPRLDGESHRMVLSGYTVGNTRGYAYPQGDSHARKIIIPQDTNTIIRVKGIATVVGGTSSTYTVGTTEGFAYYTAFKSSGATITQLGTAGGQQEFSIREGSNPTTCTMTIDVGDGGLRFGLDDSQTDTKRVWQITVDMDINNIANMQLGYDENWAIYQNADNIELQNNNLLIWN